MKRLLPIFPIVLLILLNACGNNPPTVPVDVGTAVALTQTAAIWTPTITSTPDPNEAKIVEWLNAELAGADPLERTLDANYLVRGVSFPLASGSVSTIFVVEVRCQCAVNQQCCLPERMFVVTMDAMRKRADKIIEQVPGSTSEVRVVCYNQGSQIAVLAAWWKEVKDYLLEPNNGYMLGSRVWYSTLP